MQKNVAFFVFFYVLKKRTQKNVAFFKRTEKNDAFRTEKSAVPNPDSRFTVLFIIFRKFRDPDTQFEMLKDEAN